MKFTIRLTLLMLFFYAYGQKIQAQTITLKGYELKTSSIYVNIGEEVKMEASGEVTFGFFAGGGSPNGIHGFSGYNIIPNANHGALLARVKGGNWQPIGSKGTLKADKSGLIEFIVNDRERSNNMGYFTIKIDNNEWVNALPDCPCTAPSASNPSDGWAVDDAEAVAKYHIGAKICFRSYPAVPTSEGNSGQQCCYDNNDDLITGGKAAGTPDKESSAEGENDDGSMDIWYLNVINHAIKDVMPFSEMTLQNYHKIWTPNNDNGCQTNIK